ncbi:hypothetical protein H0H92_012834 [Tricholoma furcatifolium]|nr:hypothetical protein H0H92_012834 [Tricholoma furcatifolium]
MAETLALTLGAIVVSTFFSFLTMGVVLTATWQYFLYFPKDRWIFKLLVATVFAFSLTDTIADGYWCYQWAVTYYGQPTIFAILPVSLIIEIFCVGSTSLVVQVFFAWRVWKISHQRNYLLPAFICSVSFLQWGVVLWVVVYWSEHRLLEDVGGVLPIGYAWLVSSVVADLTITASMAYYLGIRLKGQAMRSKASFNQIISRTIQSNILSLCSQIITFALFKANVGLYFFLNDFTVVKVYAFSLIISCRFPIPWVPPLLLTARKVNTRKGSSALFNSTEGSDSKPTGISLSNLSNPFRGGARATAPGVSINVHSNVEVEAEGDSWEQSQSYLHNKVDPEAVLTHDKAAEMNF